MIIAANRQSRPNLPSVGCPFCPGGIEAPEPYDVRWFANRWPAMGTDRCEVVLYTPEHDAAFWQLGVEGAHKVTQLWAERTAELGSKPDVNYVLVFENRGPEVGATIAHPHGQIYAYTDIPPVAVEELRISEAAGRSAALDPGPEELAICESGAWRAEVPQAAWWPYEMLIAPNRPIGALCDDDADLEGLAAVLVDALARLDQLFDQPMPYMMWWHQRPFDGNEWPTSVAHLHITPIWRAAAVPRFAAAAELGGGIYFNPVDPAAAAAQLRALPGVGQTGQ